MINSRKLDELCAPARARVDAFLDACKNDAHLQSLGVTILVTSTFRDFESQNSLYAQGRTTPGRKVTNAKGGQSWHNWRCAIDIVPIRMGKCVWGTSGPDGELWAYIGELGVSAGLEWAGNWKRFKEFAHFQYTGGLTLAQLNAGATIV